MSKICIIVWGLEIVEYIQCLNISLQLFAVEIFDLQSFFIFHQSNQQLPVSVKMYICFQDELS